MATPPTHLDRARDIAVLACALSAGVHAGLVPEHLHESGRLAAAFVAAAGLGGFAAAALRRFPDRRWPAAAVAVLLGALLGAYGLSRAAGLAALGSEREAVDPLGLSTIGVELLGLVAAVRLWTEPKSSVARSLAGHPIRGG